MSGGVEGGVVVGRRAVVVPRLVAFCVERRSLGIQSTDWLGGTERDNPFKLMGKSWKSNQRAPACFDPWWEEQIHFSAES